MQFSINVYRYNLRVSFNRNYNIPKLLSAWRVHGFFGGALDHGADGFELDTRLTKDGVPVVFHDALIGRCLEQEGACIFYAKRGLLWKG